MYLSAKDWIQMFTENFHAERDIVSAARIVDGSSAGVREGDHPKCATIALSSLAKKYLPRGGRHEV